MNVDNNTNEDTTTQVETAVEVQRYPAHFTGVVKGLVQHRVGDGPLEAIPVGTEVQIDTALASYVLSWMEDATNPVTVTLAKRELEHYVDTGELKVVA